MAIMDLVIQTLSGTSFDLRVSPYETVMSVKARIQTHEGIPISQQHLIFRNCELKDDYCLNDYAIQNGATLRLVLAMRGGPINTKRVSADEEAASVAYETVPSVVDFADFVDTDYVVDKLTEDETVKASSDGQTVANSKMTLLVVSDGNQVSFYRLVGRGDTTTSRSTSSSSSIGSDQQEDSDDSQFSVDSRSSKAVRMTRNATSTESFDVQQHSEDSRSTQTAAKSETTPAALVRSDSVPSSSTLNPSRPTACSFCSRLSTDRSETSGNSQQNATGTQRRPAANHLAGCPFRNATEELKRFKENADLRSTMRALRSKMAKLRVNRERLRAQGADSDPAESGAEVAGESKSKPGKPIKTDVAKPSPRAQKTQETPHSVAAETKKTSSVAPNSSRGVKPAARSTQTDAGVSTSNVPPIKSRLMPLRGLEQRVSTSTHLTAVHENEREEVVALEANRVLSSLKRRQQLLEPIGVTRLRSDVASSSTSTDVDSVTNEKLAAAQDSPSKPLPTPERHRVPSGDLQVSLPPIGSPRNSKVGPDVAVAADDSKPAALNVSIKDTITASINLFSALQQNATTAKPAAPTTSSKQRCAFCGRKTGLASTYACRCSLNFCALHRYAEAHNCTFDYKAEGRRTIMQQNPLVTAQKLPKI